MSSSGQRRGCEAMRRICALASSTAARAALPAMKSEREAAVVQSWGARSVATSCRTWTFRGVHAQSVGDELCDSSQCALPDLDDPGEEIDARVIVEGEHGSGVGEGRDRRRLPETAISQSPGSFLPLPPSGRFRPSPGVRRLS